MPDVYATITSLGPDAIAQVADAMEVSARNPQHRAMVSAYLDDLELRANARVLEIGCGTGAIAREIAGRPEVGDVLGVDPSPQLLEHARSLAGDIRGLRFEVGDGRRLALPDAAFDAVVLHRVLSHVPEPGAILAEAWRVLVPDGRLAVFDGDYASITLATTEADPLETCVRAFRPAFVTDPWLIRRLARLVDAAGFIDGRLRSFGFVQVKDPDYMLGIADRGADALAASGTIGVALAEALKQEARRRVTAGSFFGHVAYASLSARKTRRSTATA